MGPFQSQLRAVSQAGPPLGLSEVIRQSLWVVAGPWASGGGLEGKMQEAGRSRDSPAWAGSAGPPWLRVRGLGLTGAGRALGLSADLSPRQSQPCLVCAVSALPKCGMDGVGDTAL